MTTLSFIYFYLLVGLLGLAIGSFLNAVIYRLPTMLTNGWADNHSASPPPRGAEQAESTIHLLWSRSFCPQCKTPIKAHQNIPLLSYCLLRGRCKACHQPISRRYPLVELSTCLLTLFAVGFFGLTPQLPFIVLFIWFSIGLFFIDIETQLLPDTLTLGLLWLGLLMNAYQTSASIPLSTAVFGAASGYLSLWLFTQLFYLLRGKKGMGHGDFKLFAALGAWFGWQSLPFILFTASLTGAIVGIIYLKLKQKDKDTPVPFGPFLIISGLICLFYPDLPSIFLSAI